MENEHAIINHRVIVGKAKELAEKISNSSEIEFYKQAEEQINSNEKVQELIDQIRNKQKEAVSYEAVRNSDLIQKVEKEMDELHRQLDDIPLVTQFRQTQVEINDLLQMVTNVIANTVSDRIVVSTGDDPLSDERNHPLIGKERGSGGYPMG